MPVLGLELGSYGGSTNLSEFILGATDVEDLARRCFLASVHIVTSVRYHVRPEVKLREKLGLPCAERLGTAPCTPFPSLSGLGGGLTPRSLSLLDDHHHRASPQPFTLCLQNPPALSLLWLHSPVFVNLRPIPRSTGWDGAGDSPMCRSPPVFRGSSPSQMLLWKRSHARG